MQKPPNGNDFIKVQVVPAIKGNRKCKIQRDKERT